MTSPCPAFSAGLFLANLHIIPYYRRRIRLRKEDGMDTTRWKSILVPREMYIDVKETAKREGRTISGQLCFAYEQYRGSPIPKLADADLVDDD